MNKKQNSLNLDSVGEQWGETNETSRNDIQLQPLLQVNEQTR
jgi:hypothetical protein